jgi:hypothetical protein
MSTREIQKDVAQIDSSDSQIKNSYQFEVLRSKSEDLVWVDIEFGSE